MLAQIQATEIIAKYQYLGCDPEKFVPWLTEEVGATESSAQDILLSVDNNLKNPDLQGCYQEEQEQPSNEDCNNVPAKAFWNPVNL